MHKNISILIPSCDNYSDIWPLLAESYDIYWSSCPYDKYIITNGEKVAPSIFESINVGKDAGWCANLITALHKIDSDYVLMHIDDLILTSSPRQDLIDIYTNELIEEDGNYIKLLNISHSTGKTHIVEQTKVAPYRTSTVFALWKKSILLELLLPEENAWQLEIEGTNRSQKYEKWYSTPEDCFTFENLVIKGTIERRALNALKKLGLHYSGERAIMSYKQNFMQIVKDVVYVFIMALPDSISKKLVELARKVG